MKKRILSSPKRALLAVACLSMLASSCSSGDDKEESGAGSGSLTVLLETGGGIFAGLTPGDAAINIRDGWSVTADKYIVSVGDVDLHLSTDESVEAEAGEVFAVDLTQVPSSGLPLWTFDSLREGRWEFNYSTLGAADGASKHDSVEQSDFDEMVANDWTYLIEGSLTKTDGQSCPPAALVNAGDKTPNGNMSGTNECYDAPTVRFVIGAPAETKYGPCEVDEVPGVAISAGGEQTVALSVHGDHIFFNGFPEGDEGGVSRLAQWLADCDLNLDGTVTTEELEAVDPAQLPEIDERYQLGGSPITPLTNMHEFWIAQVKTQGHFQGEGECPVDGVAHEHSHDHDHDHE